MSRPRPRGSSASRVYAALLRIGWSKKSARDSRVILQREGWPNYVWAFRDADPITPPMLARIAKKTGLTPRRTFAVPVLEDDVPA